MNKPLTLNQSIATLTGVGTHTASRLHKLGIRTLQDLIFHLPYRYEDRTHIHAIGALTAGMTALICGKVELVDVLPKGR
jgi:ATP-dependent DNA helicase RecG